MALAPLYKEAKDKAAEPKGLASSKALNARHSVENQVSWVRSTGVELKVVDFVEHQIDGLIDKCIHRSVIYVYSYVNIFLWV